MLAPDAPSLLSGIEMLRREFPTAGSSKASPAHWARTLLALAGTLCCWAGWAHGSALACLLLPAVHWAYRFLGCSRRGGSSLL